MKIPSEDMLMTLARPSRSFYCSFGKLYKKNDVKEENTLTNSQNVIFIPFGTETHVLFVDPHNLQRSFCFVLFSSIFRFVFSLLIFAKHLLSVNAVEERLWPCLLWAFCTFEWGIWRECSYFSRQQCTNKSDWLWARKKNYTMEWCRRRHLKQIGSLALMNSNCLVFGSIRNMR